MHRVNIWGNLHDKTSQDFSWIDEVTNIQAKIQAKLELTNMSYSLGKINSQIISSSKKSNSSTGRTVPWKPTFDT